jgi:hypothetical protein
VSSVLFGLGCLVGSIGGAVLMWLYCRDKQVIVEVSPTRYQIAAWRRERLEVNPRLWKGN